MQLCLYFVLIGCIECMRCRQLLPMCAASASLSVTWLNSASLCGGYSVQPLPNHFGFLYWPSEDHAVLQSTELMKHSHIPRMTV